MDRPLKPPVLIVDFHYSGEREGYLEVLLRRKGGQPEELATTVSHLLDLQGAELHEDMKVWLVDRDRDLSGKDGAPLAATVRRSEDGGWFAEVRVEDIESLD